MTTAQATTLSIAMGAPFSVTKGPVLVATDGTAQSEPAMIAAHQLARGGSVPIRVLTVSDTPAVLVPETMWTSPDLEAERRSIAINAAREQVDRIAGPDMWPTEVRSGSPPATIAQVGEEIGARLIVVGLGKHSLVDRMFGSETAVRLIRTARVPVLAVARGLTDYPKRIVAAVDFSTPSLRAAKAAAELAGENATITLVHIIPRDAASFAPEYAMNEYETEVDTALERIAEYLKPHTSARFERRVTSGPPARRVLEIAKDLNADLIVTGTHGRGLVVRAILGQTAGSILRGSTCSVLAVPQGLVPQEYLETSPAPHGTERLTAAQWPAALARFTSRNIGRRANLEIDDLVLGAQSEVNGYIFLGASWDQHDKRVQLMFGEQKGGNTHLTHSAGDIREIDILSSMTAPSRDVALRIARGGGQTLLTFIG
jgi:nucleotide-binding universal stress UspA family protein